MIRLVWQQQEPIYHNQFVGQGDLKAKMRMAVSPCPFGLVFSL